LRDAGVRAAFLNSTLSRADQQRVVADLKSASLQIVYVAPERLMQSRRSSCSRDCGCR
jgi:ATP-dependent DNA helicase RecQ